jgi:hypothetical protein
MRRIEEAAWKDWKVRRGQKDFPGVMILILFAQNIFALFCDVWELEGAGVVRWKRDELV